MKVTELHYLKFKMNCLSLESHLATPPEQKTLKSGKIRLKIEPIELRHISFLENEIDQLDQNLPKMTHFILPGGHVVVSTCHVARNICRRSERSCVKLAQYSEVEENILTYLNRLSDYLFVLARKLAFELQIEEIKWNV
jgi:cob(I)alamin adenosyltransferase